MLPLHLLVQSLLYDISQVGTPFDNVDKELLEQPQSWKPELLTRFMIFFGPISSIFDLNHKLRYAVTERPINIMVLGDSYQYIFRRDAWIDSQILHYFLVKRLL